MNESLSPTSRLLYTTLLATLDGEVNLAEVARLAGVRTADDLAPYLDELVTVGAVETGDHEGRGPVLTVHEVPVIPEQRTHVCVPCEDCGGCSCEYMKGICRMCHHIRGERQRAQDDIARWQRQVDDGKEYALGANATRLHRWDCKTLNSVEKGLDALEMGIEAARNGMENPYIYWPRLPMLYSAEELRRKGTQKRNCALCGPDPL
ncbi:hypothetical protein ABZ553_25290 [Streptomyces sparsogenes]|uniref:hypothetical protein n=1 Tax=Streptomyces sparsogenes TaxID=67365 RepID=UPI0033C66BC7